VSSSDKVRGSLPTELLEAVDRLGFHPWSGLTFRHTAPGRNPLSGEGARVFGGRWNPPDLVSTLYLAQPREACVAEFHRMAAGQAQGALSFLPRPVHHIQVTDLPLLDLTGDGLGDVGLTEDDVAADDLGPCQLVGEAAYFLHGAGLVAPSATHLGLTIAVFETRAHGQLDLIDLDDAIQPAEAEPAPPRPLS
jgi:RES domain-containing protein